MSRRVLLSPGSNDRREFNISSVVRLRLRSSKIERIRYGTASGSAASSIPGHLGSPPAPAPAGQNRRLVYPPFALKAYSHNPSISETWDGLRKYLNICHRE